mmetsp:Transcript_106922/g.244877  ORF Transcript_106922/g.244877 Transcript_106922/m.244877 type:complete len:236 (-) Transcript_106922:4-711(-)
MRCCVGVRCDRKHSLVTSALPSRRSCRAGTNRSAKTLGAASQMCDSAASCASSSLRTSALADSNWEISPAAPSWAAVIKAVPPQRSEAFGSARHPSSTRTQSSLWCSQAMCSRLREHSLSTIPRPNGSHCGTELLRAAMLSPAPPACVSSCCRSAANLVLLWCWETTQAHAAAAPSGPRLHIIMFIVKLHASNCMTSRNARDQQRAEIHRSGPAAPSPHTRGTHDRSSGFMLEAT